VGGGNARQRLLRQFGQPLETVDDQLTPLHGGLPLRAELARIPMAGV
jgi:hypothetical protein